MARRDCPAPAQAAVLNYLRTAGWRGIGAVPASWLQHYLWGRETRATRQALMQLVINLRKKGYPIRTLRGFGYIFEPAAAAASAADAVSAAMQGEGNDEPGHPADGHAHADDDRPPQPPQRHFRLGQSSLGL